MTAAVLDEHVRTTHKDAAVPIVAALGKKRLRAIDVRLLAELRDGERSVADCLAPLDVTVARFRRFGRDAEGDDVPGAREFGAGEHRCSEPFRVRDVVVGREEQQNAFWVEITNDLCGHRRSRSRIAPDRLEHVGRGLNAELMELGGDHEAMVGI